MEVTQAINVLRNPDAFESPPELGRGFDVSLFGRALGACLMNLRMSGGESGLKTVLHYLEPDEINVLRDLASEVEAFETDSHD